LDADRFDAVVASVDCGWRKPHDRAFEAVARELDVRPTELVHVGDDARTDGGAERAGGRTILTSETPLSAVPDRLVPPGAVR
ncbi:MAG: HAD family hydrolase, partial [Haloplanus sp.]